MPMPSQPRNVGRKPFQTARLALDLVTLAGLTYAALQVTRTLRPSKADGPRLDAEGPATRSVIPSLAAQEGGRGRQADRPGAIPAAGWKDIVKRTWKEFRDDNLMLVAAGVTFYTLLAFFPGIAVFAAIYGAFADLGDVYDQVRALSAVFPQEVVTFVADQMVAAATAKPASLSFAFIGGLAVSVWSANGAVKALILALNIAYEEQEKRSFLKLAIRSLSLTVGAVGLMGLLVATGLATELVAHFVHARTAFALSLLRWPLLFGLAGLAIASLYRFGPSREPVQWRWISLPSLGVTAVWVAVSIGFSTYLGRFAHYDATYGSLGAIMAFMVWIYLSVAILLVGAELNAEIEHQTVKDTTVGAPTPVGTRGAAMADTVGASQ